MNVAKTPSWQRALDMVAALEDRARLQPVIKNFIVRLDLTPERGVGNVTITTEESTRGLTK